METTLAQTVTHLIEPGHLDWPQAIAKLSTNPARILGIDRGTLQVGAEADVTIIDPVAQWCVQAEQFRSKSQNTPINGSLLTGKVMYTLVDGQVRFQAS